jgi:Tfp pilus assembly protein PilF
MKKPCQLLFLACSASVLMSCGTAVAPPDTAIRVEPGLFIRNSDGGASGFYQLGRRYQEQNRLEQAADAYLRAIGLDSGYLDARNALATVYAAQRKPDQAIAQFKLVLNTAPGLAHVRNNLGYVYYLQGNYASAIAEFDKALAIEPGNQRAHANRGLAYRELGDIAKSDAAFAAARLQSGSKPAFKADAAAADAVKSGQQTLPAWNASASASVNLAAPESGNVMLAAPAADPLLPTIPVAAKNAKMPAESKSQAAQRSPRLEIADATKVAGLADNVARILARIGLPATRVVTLQPQLQRRTVILYRDGFHGDAVRLSRSFAQPPALVNNTRMRDPADGSDIRLLLGSKTAQQASQLAADVTSIASTSKVAAND